MRRFAGSSRLFLLALVSAAVLSLLPPRSLAWADDVAAIALLPATPFGDLGTRLRTWLRPGAPYLEHERRERTELQRELERFRRLYEAAELRNRELLDQLEQIERYRREGGRPGRLVNARIVGEAVAGPGRLFRLNLGAKHGVEEGSVAVFNGVHLIGRVISVERLGSVLRPITDESSEPLQVYLPHPDPENEAGRRARQDAVTLLEPTGDGTLEGPADAAMGVERGALVLLNDPGWPGSARGLTVGRVASVREREDDPLRVTIVVRPAYRAGDLAGLLLRIGDEEPPA